MEPGAVSSNRGIAYSPEAQVGREARAVQRESRLQETGMAPVEGMTAGQVSDLQSFYNNTLDNIDQLRYPGNLPDLNGLTRSGQVAKTDPTYCMQLAQRIGRTVGPDGREMALSPEQCKILATSLSHYDQGTLQNLESDGMHIKLYDTNNPPPGGYPGGRTEWDSGLLGYRVRKDKVICLRQQDFQYGNHQKGMDVAHHEIAHAVDDMLYPDVGEGRMATDNDAYLKNLYSNYLSRTDSNNSLEWSNYAKKNQREYFAEGVERYLGGDKTKDELRQKDPALFAYVEKALSVSSQGSNPPFPNTMYANYPNMNGNSSQWYNRYPPVSNTPVNTTPWNNGYPPVSYPPVSNVPPTIQNNQIAAYMMMMMMARMQQMMALMMSMQMSSCPYPQYYS
ncbi:MAG: zinc-dependent peptidase [Candidatus Eremiobacteraeota bacterium]|nr:zinc-dependent peptidase [Candidatus Eremiobacteraeota bacterium]